ncbi:glyoxalase [Streptomyces indicus]|uniref:Predicted lactoylglutathione lyase n=1 Tax=Streptomyces indicus TaxID=417292 RepID=A0A1G9GJI2_9ACTN|nr:glyoxalase [Streptomyces indicus]SDL00829.1 Predicted lactoylglutathione lyase [Streptomyces indicus]
MATTSATPATLTALTLEVPDVEQAQRFYAAFGVGSLVSLRESADSASGFRGFTIALTVSQPATVDHFVQQAVAAGATVVRPTAKSLWGYGGVVQAPDGTLWKIATSAKKNTAPSTPEIDEVVVLLGVQDVKASRQFYADRGLRVARSFGGKYAEFDTGEQSPAKLALYKRTGLAKDLGVPAEGHGSHRLILSGAPGTLTDPDGFRWE